MVFLWKMIASFRHLKICNHTFTWDVQYRSKVSWQSRLESQVLSFKTLKEFFRGSQTEISRKQFNSRKQNNSDEQNNWCVPLFAQTRFECMQIFFCVVHFQKGTCGLLSTLKLITRWQQTNIPAICIYSFTCWSEWVYFSLHDHNPERVCCFPLCNFNRPPKRKQMLTRKNMFFPYEIPLTYKNVNLWSVM